MWFRFSLETMNHNLTDPLLSSSIHTFIRSYEMVLVCSALMNWVLCSLVVQVCPLVAVGKGQ